jgi:hypothetical protein
MAETAPYIVPCVEALVRAAREAGAENTGAISPPHDFAAEVGAYHRGGADGDIGSREHPHVFVATRTPSISGAEDGHNVVLGPGQEVFVRAGSAAIFLSGSGTYSFMGPKTDNAWAMRHPAVQGWTQIRW